jgi:hypothetical protein
MTITITDVFIGLNAVRFLSVLGCILVFASSIVTLVHDINAVNAFVDANKSTGTNSTTTSSTSNTTNYEYITYARCFSLLT